MGKTNYADSFLIDEDFQKEIIGATPEQIEERTKRNQRIFDWFAGGTEAGDARRKMIEERERKKSQQESTDLMDAMAEATAENIGDQKMLENLYDLDDKVMLNNGAGEISR
jgi:hypothetical protein